MRRGCRHDVAELIDRQIELARVRTQAERESRADERAAAAPVLPYVAISHDAAVDPVPVATAIAEHLGFLVVDQALVDEVVHTTGVPRDVVETYNLNPHAQLEQMIADLPFMKLFSEDEYVRHLVRAVRRFAALGRVVLVGHAATLALPAGKGLRVHLTAPLDERARRRALTAGVDLPVARAQVEEEDRRRRVFCERHFGHAFDAPSATDLILDVAAHAPLAIADRACSELTARLRTADAPSVAAPFDMARGGLAGPSHL